MKQLPFSVNGSCPFSNILSIINNPFYLVFFPWRIRIYYGSSPQHIYIFSRRHNSCSCHNLCCFFKRMTFTDQLEYFFHMRRCCRINLKFHSILFILISIFRELFCLHIFSHVFIDCIASVIFYLFFQVPECFFFTHFTGAKIIFCNSKAYTSWKKYISKYLSCHIGISSTSEHGIHHQTIKLSSNCILPHLQKCTIFKLILFTVRIFLHQ